MITVNTYAVVEGCVYGGVATGIEQIKNDKTGDLSNPEKLVEVLTSMTMQHLAQVLDFGIQPIRFTPDMIAKLTHSPETVNEPESKPDNT